MEEKELVNETEASLPPKITKDNIDPEAGSTKGKIMMWVRAVVYSLISSLLIAVAAHSLIAPNEFTIGGASGVAILINVATGIPQSVLLLGINLPLLVLAFFFVKKRFAILSAMNIGMQSLWLLLFEQVFPDFKIQFTGSEAEKIFAAIAAGLCIGAAIALAFKVGGSTGGMDIAAVMIQKKFKASSIAWTIFSINVVIICLSLIVFYDPDIEGGIAYNLLPIMLAAFESYVESKTNEAMMNGFQSAREFRIITDKPEAMAQALMKELSRGVTAIPATGMYTKFTHTMLLCVVNRRQEATVKRIMKQIDPDSFAVMSNVSQVLGLGFYAEEL